MSLSDVYNRIVGSLTASNNSLPNQEASTYTSITTSSSSIPNSFMAASQNQQIVNQLNAQQQLANQLTQNSYLQQAYQMMSSVTYGYAALGASPYGVPFNPNGFETIDTPEDKKKKDKEMLVNILKSKLQDAK